MPSILVVDNENSVLELVVNILEREGLPVQAAATASEALDIVQRDPEITLAVLDWRMPGTAGEQILDQLSSIRPALRAIVMSGDDLRTVQNAFAGRNVIRFLEKPFHLRALVTVVRSAVAR